MTIAAITEAIARLIIKRRDADEAEQARINEKLSKLYDLKSLALQQEAKSLAN